MLHKIIHGKLFYFTFPNLKQAYKKRQAMGRCGAISFSNTNQGFVIATLQNKGFWLLPPGPLHKNHKIIWFLYFLYRNITLDLEVLAAEYLAVIFSIISLKNQLKYPK